MVQGKQVRPNFTRLFSRLRAFNTHQRLAVCCFMSALVNGERIAALIDQIARARSACPRCASRQFGRHGFANGLQRYRCSACGKTFNGLTGTPLARLRLKGKWLAYCDCLRDPACTVKSAAEKVQVHANTSFRWRHRFLHWVKFDRPATLQGITEADETFLLESEKGNRQGKKQSKQQSNKQETDQDKGPKKDQESGQESQQENTPLGRAPRKRGGVGSKRGISRQLVNIVVARDRGGATIDFIAGRGALTATALHTHLLPKLQRDVLLVSDANAAYKKFAREAGIDHQSINLRQGVRVREAIHIQNVNAYHSRFKRWLHHFNGVATRFLDNYLGWCWAIDLRRIGNAERFLAAALGHFGA